MRLDYLAGKREIHSDIVLGLKYPAWLQASSGRTAKCAEIMNTAKVAGLRGVAL